jgi:hypothetical protein
MAGADNNPRVAVESQERLWPIAELGILTSGTANLQ